MKLTHPYSEEKERPCIILFHVCFLDDVGCCSNRHVCFYCWGPEGCFWAPLNFWFHQLTQDGRVAGHGRMGRADFVTASFF